VTEPKGENALTILSLPCLMISVSTTEPALTHEYLRFSASFQSQIEGLALFHVADRYLSDQTIPIPAPIFVHIRHKAEPASLLR
jgi:hypothetical protein